MIIKQAFIFCLLAFSLNACYSGLNIKKLKPTSNKEAYDKNFDLIRGIMDLQRKTVYFKASGYYIYVEQSGLSYSYPNVKKILNFRGGFKSKEVKKKGLRDNIRVFEYSFNREKKRSYIAKYKDNRLFHIVFSSESYNDEEFEVNFVNTIAEHGISSKLLYPNKLKQIKVLDKEIDLLETCSWVDALNLDCPKNGRITWAYHSNRIDAEYYLNELKSGFEVNEKLSRNFVSDTLNAKFLGVDTKVERREYNITYPTNEWLEADKLVSYYVIIEKDSLFVHANLNHYNNDNTFLIDQFLEFE